mmetsp:Transcript_27618/g.33564  ORF Transcript_27618/g.33564 Transcript_27618/m.33564 type:complete len:457 (+) Transcript_27618:165-1535(+)
MRLYLSQLIFAYLVGSNTASCFQTRPAASFRKQSKLSLSFLKNVEETTQKIIAGTILTGLMWSAPVTIAEQTPINVPFLTVNRESVVAQAREMASGTGSRVNKDPESLLRYGLPINNKEVRQLQATIETIKQDLASKRKSAALDGVKASRNIIKSKASKMTASCQSSTECSAILSEMDAGLSPLESAVQASTKYLNGSDQERKALDEAYQSQVKLSKLLTKLQEQMIPKGYVTPVPEEYSDLPQLKGRATVEFVLRKPDGAPFDVEGTNYPEAKLTMIIDGYAAPVTAGNFIDLVNKGFYDKMDVQRSDGFVVQTGEPKGDAVGYVGKPSKSIGAGKNGERLIPNEIFVKGDKGPFYETTIEDEGRGGQATILPFSSYGAMGWARDEYDPNSGSSQFFWLLFDSDLTPAGKNVLDGRYPCFGYVVEGADFLRDTKEGDTIVSTKITSGIENLVSPS